MGTVACNPSDFTNVRLFVKNPGSSSYASANQLFYSGGGCLKWNQIYAISLLSGASEIVACVAQTDGSENYCTDPMSVTTDSGAGAWQ